MTGVLVKRMVTCWLGAVALGACTSAPVGDDGPEDGRSPAAAAAEITPTEPVTVDSWEGGDLPRTASGVTRLGRTGYYFGVDEDEGYSVVAVDLLTGREKWRQAADPHDRSFGLVVAPTVDPQTGLVFVNRLTPMLDDDDRFRIEQAALDAERGAPRWRRLGLLSSNEPTLCGQHAVCVRNEGWYLRRDRTSGRPIVNREAVPGRRVGHNGDRLLLAGEDIRLVEQGDEAERELWRVPIPDVDDGSGTWTSDSTWHGWILDEDDGGAAFLALGWWPLGHTGPLDDDQFEERLLRGTAALVVVDGEVRWQHVGARTCDLALSDGIVILCDDPQLEGEGDDAELRFGRLTAVDVAAGSVVWDLPLPSPLPSAPGRAVPTTDERFEALHLLDGSRHLLDRTTGALTPLEDADPDLLIGCTKLDRSQVRAARAEVHLPYREGDGPFELRRAHSGDLLEVCRAVDGSKVDLADLVAAGQQPPAWFGPAAAVDPGGADLPAEEEVADRWWISVTPDGVLSGVGPRAEEVVDEPTT